MYKITPKYLCLGFLSYICGVRPGFLVTIKVDSGLVRQFNVRLNRLAKANTLAYPIAWVIRDEEKTVLIKLTPDGNPSNARNL
jgi:hypothetical protein